MNRLSNKWVIFLAVFTCLSSFSDQKQPVERVGSVAIAHIPVRGFEKLTAKDKILAYYLYQASIAGRDINFDQNYRHNLSIRKLCEEILLHSKGIQKNVLADIAHYLKMQYIHVGIHEKMTFAKFLPPSSLTFKKLEDAAEIAKKNGASFEPMLGKTLQEHLNTLNNPIFDKNTDAFSTTRLPMKDQDIVQASAINYYSPDITEKEALSFNTSYTHNASLLRKDGKLVEIPWKVNGMYSDQLQQIVDYLGEAKAFASKANARSIDRLIRFYRSGKKSDFKKYNIACIRFCKACFAHNNRHET